MATRSRRPRNDAAPTPVTVADWGHARARWMDCPSGAGKVLFTPTSLPRAILGGFIPNPLEGIARQVTLKGFDPNEPDVTDEQWEEFENFRDWLISDCIKSPKVSPEFVRQVDDAEPHMPFEDREHFWLAAIHGTSFLRPGSSDGRSLSALASLLDLSKFRDEPAGAQPAEDGPGTGGAAE